MNKYWKIVDGKMVRRLPEITTESSIEADGLSMVYTTVKTVTLNIEQLKRACTADRILLPSVTRDGALKVLSGLIRAHRYDLFGTFEGYRIITNGYGQFKEVAFSHGNPVKAETIFNKLKQLTCN